MGTDMAEGMNGILGTVMTFAPLLLLVVVFYFMLLRPQRKREKAVKQMLADLKVGDRVMTIGGMYGTITAIRENAITIAVGQDKVKLVFDRSAIRGLDETPPEEQNEVL